MSDGERLTVTMPADLATAVRRAVEGGDYASTSEVIHAALREWEAKRALESEELAALRADIAMGIADVAAGRVNKFSANEIIARGKKILAESSPSD